MTDDEQAESVVNGLADNETYVCVCGHRQVVGKPSDDTTAIAEQIGFMCEGCGMEWSAERYFNKAQQRPYWVWRSS